MTEYKLEVQTDKQVYHLGDTVEISGSLMMAPDVPSKKAIGVEVRDKMKAPVFMDQIYPDINGNFKTSIKLPDAFIGVGTIRYFDEYKIYVSGSGTGLISTTTFRLAEVSVLGSSMKFVNDLESDAQILVSEQETFKLQFTVTNNSTVPLDVVLHDGMYEWIWGNGDYCMPPPKTTPQQFPHCQALSEVVAAAWGYIGPGNDGNPKATIEPNESHTFESLAMDTELFLKLPQPVEFHMEAYGRHESIPEASSPFTNTVIKVHFAEKKLLDSNMKLKL